MNLFKSTNRPKKDMVERTASKKSHRSRPDYDAQENIGFLDRIVGAYARMIVKYPVIIFIICILVFAAASQYSKEVKTKSENNRDSLPKDVDVIKANDIFENSFGGTSSAIFVFELDTSEPSSSETRDLRTYEVMKHYELIERFISESDQVTSVSSATATMRLMNNGVLPKTDREIRSMIEENGLLSRYISDDGSMMIMYANLKPGYDEYDVVEDMEFALQSAGKIPGVSVKITGEPVQGVFLDRQISTDMSTTSMFSMIAIIVILLFVFASVKYAFLPLTTIIVGIVWTMGFIGLRGLTLSTATSGVISMIIGIGIDFGIQIIMRFRQELRETDPDNAMLITIKAVLIPMIITTTAAVIGFWAMTTGQLKFLGAMGTMMMYGVIFCFFAAITFVPSLTLLVEKHSHKIRYVFNDLHINRSHAKYNSNTRSATKSKRN